MSQEAEEFFRRKTIENTKKPRMKKFLALVNRETEGKIMQEYANQQLRLHGVVGSVLLADLLKESKEVIAINGLRFTGTHEEAIKNVFDKHGINYEPPF